MGLDLLYLFPARGSLPCSLLRKPPVSPETAHDLAAPPGSCCCCRFPWRRASRPVRSPKTARDLAARHDQALMLMPISLTPLTPRGARYRKNATPPRLHNPASRDCKGAVV